MGGGGRRLFQSDEDSRGRDDVEHGQARCDDNVENCVYAPPKVAYIVQRKADGIDRNFNDEAEDDKNVTWDLESAYVQRDSKRSSTEGFVPVKCEQESGCYSERQTRAAPAARTVLGCKMAGAETIDAPVGKSDEATT
eukprot:TRINITY_DN1281_c0_g1_i1.p1 TRINITY_DN1281_c0_g1~~TRINITY_DN1281_c0_g1_i1.p1  ORF type:complete len:138 (-),score=17.69 TRINITY_DN1281_c0_g1_i1:809-1222(-)